MCASRWSVCLHWHVRNVLRTCGSCFNKTNYQHYHMFCDCHHKRCIRYFFPDIKVPIINLYIYISTLYICSFNLKSKHQRNMKTKGLMFFVSIIRRPPLATQRLPPKEPNFLLVSWELRTSYWFPHGKKNDLWLIAGFWLNTISLKLTISFIIIIYRERERETERDMIYDYFRVVPHGFLVRSWNMFALISWAMQLWIGDVVWGFQADKNSSHQSIALLTWSLDQLQVHLRKAAHPNKKLLGKTCCTHLDA